MQSNNDREDKVAQPESNPSANEQQPRTFQMLGRLFLSRQQSQRGIQEQQGSSNGLFRGRSNSQAARLSSSNSDIFNNPNDNTNSPMLGRPGVSTMSSFVTASVGDTASQYEPNPDPNNYNNTRLVNIPTIATNPYSNTSREAANGNSASIFNNSAQQSQASGFPGAASRTETVRDTQMFFDTAISTFGLQPQLQTDGLGISNASQPVRSPTTPILTPVNLPRHLRQPSLPPPSGPLPRPPSRLENERIGARLSASSPGIGSSIRSKLNAYPFPLISEAQGASSSTDFQSNGTGSLAGMKNSPRRPNLSPSIFDPPVGLSGLGQVPPLNASQLSPANLSPINGSTPGSMGRQPSAHTQASSDALGENSRPSVQYDPQTLPKTDPNYQTTDNRKTNQSEYSILSASFFDMYTNRDSESAGLDLGQAAPKPLQPLTETDPFLRLPKENFEDNISSGSSDAILKRTSNRSSSKSDYSNQDLRSISRLSGLSFVSGTAFVVSEKSGNTQSNSQISYRVENVAPGLRGLGMAAEDTQEHRDFQYNEKMNNAGGLRSPVKVHPADDRFEHTYRMRRASEAEEPIYVPVYSFEPPNNFPDRTRTTAPRTTPRFVNHTPRNFSLPGRVVTKATGRASSDSAEMLLPDNNPNISDGAQLSPPAAAYGINMQSARLSRFSIPRSHRTVSGTGPADLAITQSARSQHPHEKESLQQRFETQHSHYFHDLDHLEKARRPNARVLPQVQIHGPRHSFSARYGVPKLHRANEAYIGDIIDLERWPERYKRQKRIGRSLLCVCLLMPPLWLIMAVGLLDNLVSEMTDGEIWSVGKTEKTAAAWLGGTFCFGLVVAVITVGIVVL